MMIKSAAGGFGLGADEYVFISVETHSAQSSGKARAALERSYLTGEGFAV